MTPTRERRRLDAAPSSTVPQRETAAADDELAGAILETVPGLMRAIRARMRAGLSGMSVPQFRVLLFVRRNPGTSLSPVAEHLGIALPSASQLVDRRVRSGYLDKRHSARERRMVELSLTDRGREVLEERDARTRAWLRERLAALDPERRRALADGLAALRAIGAEEPEPPRDAG